MSETGTKKEPSREEAFIARLLGDKTAIGPEVRKIAREMFPDAPVPNEDPESVVAPIKTELGDMKTQLKTALDKIAAREKADEDLKLENDLSIKISNARRNFGLTDTGTDKMIARMKETGNYSDAEAAAAWVVSQTPKPAPTSTPSWMPEAANLFGSVNKDEQFESLHKDPRKYMDDQLREFARDPDKYVADTFGTA